MVVSFNIIDVSAFNAFAVWTEVNPGWKNLKRRLFLEELGKTMVEPLIQRRQHLPRISSFAAVGRDMQASAARPTPIRGGGGKRKRCQLCAPWDVKTSFVCHKCKVHIFKAQATTACIAQHGHENAKLNDWQIVKILLLCFLPFLLLWLTVWENFVFVTVSNC